MKLKSPTARLLLIGTLALVFAGSVRADAPATQPAKLATDAQVRDLKNQAVKPLTVPPGHRALVLIFISTDCPISNTYAPLLGDLCRRFAPNRIDFYGVYEDSPLTASAASAHHDAYGYPFNALLDPRHTLAHAAGATVTPEAVVVGPGGTLLYRGRIDNLFVTVGRKRYAATTHELKDVLDQVSQDHAVTVAPESAVGCAIPQ